MESNKKTCRKRESFTDDMVFEILTWLPAKSLMRFKCVSKTWNSLIHNPNFVKLHNARSQATRLLFEIHTRHPEVIETSTCNLPSQLEGLSLQLTRPHHYFDSKENTICSNHCNGLVCLYSHKDTQSYLYNITTGEIKALPSPKGREPMLFLGFDPVTERYKLLHFVIVRGTRIKIRIKILTLGTNSWRKINHEENKYPFTCHHTCIFLNGVLYWIGLYTLVSYFNFKEEKFGTLSFPQRSRSNILNKMQSALWGKLIISCRYPTRKCDLVYDEVNKVFVEFNNSNLDLENTKVALLAAKNVDERTEYANTVLATASLNSASACLVFPDHFLLTRVSSFFENIIPLTFIIDV